ncbi:MAG TPA: hypothetical protein VGF21_09230 [Thermoleophilaceae bacterium]
MIERFASAPRPELPPGFDELTEREAETLRLIATGLSNAESSACATASRRSFSPTRQG